MATTVNIHEAKTHLSRLLLEVEAGAEVIIARNGAPLAKLVPLADDKPRQPGRFKKFPVKSGDLLLKPMNARDLKDWTESGSSDPLAS